MLLAGAVLKNANSFIQAKGTKVPAIVAQPQAVSHVDWQQACDACNWEHACD